MRLCTSDQGFDFEAWHAMQTRVTISEAKEIEAVLCVEGDNRHTFQTWYPKWAERRKNTPADCQGKPIRRLMDDILGGPIDIEVVQRELADAKEAIDETQKSLATNRQDVLGGGDGWDPRIVEALESQLEGLKNSRSALEQQLLDASGEGVSDVN